MKTIKPEEMNEEILHMRVQELENNLRAAANISLGLYAGLVTYTDQHALAAIFGAMESNLRAMSKLPFLLEKLTNDKV